MGLRPITKEELIKWRNTYTEKLQDSEKTEETTSCLLSLENLKDFVKYIDGINQKNLPDEKIDGIEIYLTRWTECKVESKIKKIPSKGKDVKQISFAIVPLEGIKNLKGTKNFFQKNDNGKEEIMCLYPGDESATGHCPPCSKQQEDGKNDSP